MKFTPYFVEQVRRKRPYLEEAWLERALHHPEKSEIQENGRIRHWIFIPEFGKYLRVVIEADRETIHNAFFDRGFRGKS